MKKITTSLLFIIVICFLGFSQPSYEWVEQLGGANADLTYSVITDDNGNVYCTGTENGKIKIYKRDALGNNIWTKTVNGTTTSAAGFSINLDGTGNVIVTGFFDATGDFDPGAGTFNLTSNGNQDIFVLKLNSSGNFIWAVSVGGTGLDNGYSVTTDAVDNVIVTGIHQGTVDFDPGPGVDNYTSGGGLWDYFILKLNSNGVYQWAISSQNPSTASGNSIDCDASNNIYVTGNFRQTVDFDPGVGVFNMTPTNTEAGYVLKLDPNGNLIWAKMFSGNNRCTPSTIDIDSNGDVITSGEYYDNLDADPGTGTFTLSTNGEQDIYIIKLNSNGDFLWAKSFGGIVPDESFGLTIDASNNIYTTGYFESNVDFDPGVGVYTLSDNGIYDIFVQKLDSNGDFVWAVSMGGTSWDRGIDIALDEPSGSLYLVGEFNSTVDFDPGSGTSYLSPIGGSDGYLLKLSDCQPSAPTPDIAMLSSLTGECSVAAPTAPTASNCSGTFNGTPNVTFPITTQGTTVVTWTYDDGNGNTSTQTQNVIIADVTAPLPNAVAGSGSVDIDQPLKTSCMFDFSEVETAQSFQATSSDICGAGIELVASGLGVSDITIELYDNLPNMGGVVLASGTVSAASGTWADVSWSSVSIISGNTYYLVFSGSNPNQCVHGHTGNPYSGGIVFTSPGYNPVGTFDITFRTFSGCSPALADEISECSVTLVAPTATDNCIGSITGTPNVTFPITTQGTTVVTWTYDDGNGNTSTQTQNVVIDDITAPVADVATLSDITSECSVTSLTSPTATDNCAGSITGTHNASLPITTQGTTVVTWTYDDGNGNTSTQTQNVVIDDITAPVADLATLSDITSECSVTSLTSPTATDNCAGSITGTHNASLPITTQGTTVVTWTYDDGNGNTSTQTQNVVIDDITDPVADIATLSDVTSECSVTSLAAPTASDNCAGSITGTHDASLPITTQGTTVVTWTYDDGNGNTTTQTQNVVIDDITGPVADVATLSNITSECSVTSLTGPTASDNCAGSITGTHDASLPITTQGTTVVTWTYDDGNGNTSTQTQNVVITDVTAPVADMAMLSDITSECEVASLTAPTATDNCAGAITGTHNATLPIASSTTVTWTYDDGNGNISTQNQNVVITPIDNTVTQVDAITLSADASGYTYQWVDCNNGNTAINGATSQTFVASANGNYAVEVSNGMCSVTSSCTVINSVGIEENQFDNTLMVYPNPTSGLIHISSSVPFNKVEVMNALGQKVGTNKISESEKYSLTMPEEYGVYFVKVYFKESTVIKRIVRR